jgi:hypothetical protein
VSRAVRAGFSVFETVAILVIIAILLLIVIPQFTKPSLAAVGGPDSVVAPGSFGKLAVKVTDSRGTVQQGVAVRFEVEGKGNVLPTEASTDSAGVAYVVWQAATDTGALNVMARAAGLARPTLVFHTRVRGQPQSAAPATTPRAAP